MPNVRIGIIGARPNVAVLILLFVQNQDAWSQFLVHPGGRLLGNGGNAAYFYLGFPTRLVYALSLFAIIDDSCIGAEVLFLILSVRSL